MTTTLLVLMKSDHGTMAGAVCTANKNAATKKRQPGRSEREQPCPREPIPKNSRTRLSALRTVSSWNVLQNMRQYNSLRLFQRTIHQLYIRVQNHVGIFDFLESGIANPNAADVGGGESPHVQHARRMRDGDVFHHHVSCDRLEFAFRAFLVKKINLQNGIANEADVHVPHENILQHAP